MSTIKPSRPLTPMSQRRTFAIVASQYNPNFVAGLVESTRKELEEVSPQTKVVLHQVPGAFEIPMIVQEVAQRGGVDAIIALGVIIQGETAHAELVGRCVTDALQRIALQFRVPVIHEVLLVKDEAQARARTLCDELNRGTEAARAAIRMCEAMAEFKRRA